MAPRVPGGAGMTAPKPGVVNWSKLTVEERLAVSAAICDRELDEQGIDPLKADPARIRKTWRLLASMGERS